MKAIIFARVSTLTQDLEQQEQVLLQTAKNDGYSDKNIIIISEHESGVKNDISERLGLAKAKEAIEQGNVEVIYAFELSRIARRLDVFYEFRNYLIEKKVQLKIINPQVCLLDKNGNIDENFSLVFSIFASLAEQEARLMQARMARGKAKARKENRYTGGQVPFGYSVDKDHNYIIKEDDAALVRRIFNDYRTKTVVEIAKDLVFEGLVKTTVNSTGSLIRNILHRKLYYGEEATMNGYTVKYPPIITKEEYDDATKKLHERKKHCKTKSKHTYLCRNIVTNINGELLRPIVSHKAYEYIKVNKFNWETLSIKIDLLDNIVLHYAIENRKKHPAKDIANIKAKLLKEMQSIDSKISNLKKSITLEQEKQIKVEMRFISGKISESTADSLNLKLQESIEHFIKMNNDLEIDRNNISERLQMLNRKTAAHDNPLLIEDYTNINQIVHQEIEKVIVIKGKTKFAYTLGIQFTDGDYVMIDVNSLSKKVYLDGVEVEYEKTSLLHSKEENEKLKSKIKLNNC